MWRYSSGEAICSIAKHTVTRPFSRVAHGTLHNHTGETLCTKMNINYTQGMLQWHRYTEETHTHVLSHWPTVKATYALSECICAKAHYAFTTTVHSFPLTSTYDKANRNECVCCSLEILRNVQNILSSGKIWRETCGCHRRARNCSQSLQKSRNDEFGLNKCLHIRTHLFSIRIKYPLTFAHLPHTWQIANRHDRTQSITFAAMSTLGECTCSLVFG